MTNTENFLSLYYQHAWASDTHNIHWTQLEILNRIQWTNPAYGKMIFLLEKKWEKYL